MDGPPPEELDALIAQFCGIAAGASHTEAQNALATNGWDLELALASHFSGADEDTSDQAAEADYTGPRTLDGRPAPEAAASSSSKPSRSAKPKQSGLRTLKDIHNQAGPAHAEDDDDDTEDENQDMYAGGEKSGLSVQNPGAPRDAQSALKEMMRRAAQNAPRPGGDDAPQRTSHFTGTAHTLGGDDIESRTITDPNPRRAPPAPPQHRELHLWRNGFSIDDGPLYRFDDPANTRWLQMINNGEAPLELMNVRPGQEVDVHLNPHRDEDFVQQKKKYKPFGGEGQRLGSPTPGVSSSAPPTTVASSSQQPASSTASPGAPSIDIDNSQPTLTLQIRLGDGTRLRSQFNTTHTIGDVYNFVDRASATNNQRSYALMTTFPSKELTDRKAILGEMTDLKRGGVVVQKWT